MARDKSTEDAARARIGSQMPITQKSKYADEVIDNSKTKEDLDLQVRKLLEKLDRETLWTWLLEWLVPPLGLVAAALTVSVRAVGRRVRTEKTE